MVEYEVLCNEDTNVDLDPGEEDEEGDSVVETRLRIAKELEVGILIGLA